MLAVHAYFFTSPFTGTCKVPSVPRSVYFHVVHLETTWLLHLFLMCTVQKPIKYIYLQLGYMFTIILQAPGKVPLKTKVRIVHLDYTVSFTIFLKLVTFFHSQSSQEANFSCLQYMLTFLLHHLQAPAKYLLYQGQYFHDCSLKRLHGYFICSQCNSLSSKS